MAEPDQAADTKGQAPAKVPFGLRLKAWWDGTELPAPDEIDREIAPGPAGAGSGTSAAGPAWDGGRIALAQRVWGAGFTRPGTPDDIVRLVSPLDINAATTVIELGAGLGGAARAVADHFGALVTALEPDPGLAAAGMALSTEAGLAKKAAVAVLDVGALPAEHQAYDCAFSKEFLFTVRDKGRLLRAVDARLGERSQVLLTDYVLGSRTPEVEAWIEADPERPSPWTADDYLKLLAELGFDVRAFEDRTEATRQAITSAWAAFAERVDRGGPEEAPGRAIVEEAETWARRVRLLESGGLTVCCLHAVRDPSDELIKNA